MWIGVLRAGVREAMWINHVRGKFRHGRLEKPLINAARRSEGRKWGVQIRRG